MTDERVVRLLREMVAIESVNLAYPGGTGEAAMADYVETWARGAGLRVERQELETGQANVLVTLDVPNPTGTLLFEAHMDTVALAPMEQALDAGVRDGRVYGRGACDTKGSMAAMMVAMERLATRRDDLAVNVALVAVVDEEHTFTGVLRYIDSDAEATAAVVGEPTDLRLVIAHKGCVRGEIRTTGKAAHSAEPHLGVNAIDAMADVLVGLRELPETLGWQSHPLLGSPTFSVGLIEGGTGVNVVPAACAITYDRRILPGERPDAALAEIDAVLAGVQTRREDATIERPAPYLVSDSLDTDPDEPLVVAGSAACEAAGLDPAPIGVPYGTDASKLQTRRGIPAVVLGPGSIAQAHGADEFVPIDELRRAAEIYAGIAMRFRPEETRER